MRCMQTWQDSLNRPTRIFASNRYKVSLLFIDEQYESFFGINQIEELLRRVCEHVLTDKNVDSKHRKRRLNALANL